MKLQIECSDMEHRDAAALLALAKFFEIGNMESGDINIAEIDNYGFWAEGLPTAISTLCGNIEFVITAFEHSEKSEAEIFADTKAWRLAAHWMIQEGRNLLTMTDEYEKTRVEDDAPGVLTPSG